MTMWRTGRLLRGKVAADVRFPPAAGWLLCLLMWLCVGASFGVEFRTLVATGSFGAVSCGHPEAVKAAVRMLERGGNAVDAAAAAGFVLGVTDLSNSGCGGEGYALIHLPGGTVEAWDGSIRIPLSPRIGSSAIGLPTIPALLIGLIDRHGTKVPVEVMASAIKLAKEGFPLSGYLEQVVAKRIEHCKDPAALALFAPRGRPLRAGEKLVQPALAKTLCALATDHGESFYRGELARILVEDLAARGSGYKAADLAAYAPKRVDPVSLEVGSWKLVGTPPPSSSVVTMALVRDLVEDGKSSSPKGFLELGRKALLRKRRDLTSTFRDPQRYFRSSHPAPAASEGPSGEDQPDGNTTHLVVWDRHGMIVSMTLTLGSHFGTGELSPLGFFYNNEMKNFGGFSAFYPRDYPKDAGPVSSKSPLLVFHRGEPILAIGGAGNNRIITNVAAVTADVILEKRPLVDSIHAPREFPEESRNAILEWFPGIASRTGEVRSQAWRSVTKPAGDDSFGLVAGVAKTGTHLTAVGDYRREGSAGAVRRNPNAPRGYSFEVLAWKKSGVTDIGLVEPIVSPRQSTEGWQSSDPVPITLEATGPITRARMRLSDPSSAVRLVQHVAIFPDRKAIAPAPYEAVQPWTEKPILSPREREFLSRVPENLSPRRLVEWLLVKVGLEMPYRKVPGIQSPDNLLERGEGDCSGKAQLMVDILRHRGIPCRRVGGAMLANGVKEVTHAWLDVWLDGTWTPVCPVNMVFGRLPAHWLIMRYGTAQSMQGANRLMLRVRELKSQGDFPASVEEPGDGDDSWRSIDSGSRPPEVTH